MCSNSIQYILLGTISDRLPKIIYVMLTTSSLYFYVKVIRETRKPFKICIAGGPSGTGLHNIDQYFLIIAQFECLPYLKHFFTDQFICNMLYEVK